MKIKKILNNNVVIARDDDDKEVVVMSLGLGFTKKAGDIFRREDAQKIFVLSDDAKGQYKQLMRDVDPLSTEIAENIITYAADEQKLDFGDLIHITLTDHIDGMLKRLDKGVNLTNQLTLEISRVHHREFDAGLYGLKLIEEKTGYKPIRDEAAFIALHFVNNMRGVPQHDEHTNSVIKFINDVISVVEEFFHIELVEDTMSYYRFVLHLKYLVKRICGDGVYNDDPTLYESISKAYPASAKCVDKIVNVIKLKYHKDVSTEEKAYLTIYVEKLTRESNEIK